MNLKKIRMKKFVRITFFQKYILIQFLEASQQIFILNLHSKTFIKIFVNEIIFQKLQ